MYDAVVKGNLTADPEVKVSAKGTEFVTFTIAHNEVIKQGEEYVKVEGVDGKGVVTFFDVAVFGSDADLYAIASDVKKGQYVKVEGAVARRDYKRTDGTVGSGFSVKFVKSLTPFEKKDASEKKIVETSSAPF
jgi:single-stranded DNA-binding protein